ncbi:MAG: hypothetical protein IKZ82_07805 [Clostridia bacterium]|nr:hypothetical protein [Clostridia bacterium]
MKYSKKLNGFYEEGYHYYIEIRDERLTVRDYRRAVALETTISYDAESIERTELALADNVLSRAADGSMMTEIKSLHYDGGELKMLYYYTIMGETLYTLKKVEKGPFDHIMIRDTEFLQALQGKWTEYLPNGKKGSAMVIAGSNLSWMGMGPFAFHAISCVTSPNTVRLVPANLIDSDFGGFTSVEVEKNTLSTRMIIHDASAPLCVFMRQNDLKRGDEVLAERDADIVTSIFGVRPKVDEPPMRPDGPMTVMTAVPEAKKPRFCRECGYAFGEKDYKFCPDCGAKRQ